MNMNLFCRASLSLLLAATLCLAQIMLTGCGKDQVSIGKGNPSEEFESCLKLLSKNSYEDSIRCLEMYKARYPNTAEGQDAELKIGDVQFAKKEYLLAAESYMAFLRLYPASPRVDYAHYRAGVAYFKESPKAIDRDQEYLGQAIEHLRTVVTRYPSSQYADLSRLTLHVALNRIAKRNFYVGRFYYRTGEYLAAIPRFKEVADNFPDSGIADRALYLMVKSDLKIGRFEDAKGAYGQLAAKYPKSGYAKKAEEMLLSAAKKK